MENVVLLVDDDQNILHGLARALRRLPYQLYTATSGEEALLILKRHNVDVIVTDERMPGMCGGDVLAWVAENYPEVTRIVLTGHPAVETAIRAINEGAVYEFLTKPCNPALLGVAIRKALEHKALLTENRQLLDINRRQLQKLEDYRRDLEILTSLVAQDMQEPLRTVARSCRLLEEQYHDIFDPKARVLVDNAVDGVAEVHRLVNDLLEHCHTQGPGSPTNRSLKSAWDRRINNCRIVAFRSAKVALLRGAGGEIATFAERKATLVSSLILAHRAIVLNGQSPGTGRRLASRFPARNDAGCRDFPSSRPYCPT